LRSGTLVIREKYENGMQKRGKSKIRREKIKITSKLYSEIN
jgi:hypothetical protein